MLEVHGDKKASIRNMCDRELDQPLLSPHSCHRALDVSTSLTPLSVKTDVPCTRRINAARSCICHHGKEGCIVDRVHGFGIIRHANSRRKFPYVGVVGHNT